MEVPKLGLVAVLVSGLVCSGVRPIEHLHRATPDNPAVVHAHLDSPAGAGPHSVAAVHDDHDDVVTLDSTLAGGPGRHAPSQPVALAGPASAHTTRASGPLTSASELVPTPSPPSRSSPSRAPPA